MYLRIGGGVLTTEHEVASFLHPVFVFQAIAYQSNDLIDGIKQNARRVAAANFVTQAVAVERGEGRRYSVAEYDLIERFAAQPMDEYG